MMAAQDPATARQWIETGPFSVRSFTAKMLPAERKSGQLWEFWNNHGELVHVKLVRRATLPKLSFMSGLLLRRRLTSEHEIHG